MITARLVSGATARSSGISQPQPTGGLHARPGHEMDLPASPRLSRKAKPSSHSASPPWRGRRGRSSARTRAGCRSWPCLVRPWGERVPGLRHRSLHCLFRNVLTGRGPISSRPFSVTRPRSRRERRSLAEGGMPTRWPRSWLRPEVPDRRGRAPQLKRRLGDAAWIMNSRATSTATVSTVAAHATAGASMPRSCGRPRQGSRPPPTPATSS